MRRMPFLFSAMGILLLAASISATQAPPAGAAPGQGRGRGAPLPPITNLQVLPSNSSQQQVVQIMQAFTQALGVNCGHCHMWESQGNPANDYASDAKPTKNIARAMMRLAGDINAKIPAAVNKTAETATRVQCMTCHRGAAIPALPLPPPAPARQGGPA